MRGTVGARASSGLFVFLARRAASVGGWLILDLWTFLVGLKSAGVFFGVVDGV